MVYSLPTKIKDIQDRLRTPEVESSIQYYQKLVKYISPGIPDQEYSCKTIKYLMKKDDNLASLLENENNNTVEAYNYHKYFEKKGFFDYGAMEEVIDIEEIVISKKSNFPRMRRNGV